MKKIIVILVAVIAAVFTSCSNEQAGIITTSNNVVEENANVANFVALQDQISTFNDSLGINHQVTRGFFSRLWKVICADAVGGLFGNRWGGPAGAVVGAAACSGGAALENSTRAFAEKKIDFRYEMDTDLDGLVPSSTNGSASNSEDSIGYFHNKALVNLKNSNKLISIHDMPVLLLDEVKNEIPQNTTFTDKDSVQLNKTYQEFVANEEKFTGNDISSYEKHLVDCYPSQSNEIKVICEFLKGITNIDAVDANSYTSKILEMVENTQLPGNIKRNLRNGVIVGNASKKLWKLQPKKYEKVDIKL